jgi:hypothetical protein
MDRFYMDSLTTKEPLLPVGRVNGVRVFIHIAPLPRAPINTCNFDNEISVILVDDYGNKAPFEFSEFIRLVVSTSPNNVSIVLNGRVIPDAELFVIERLCWRFLYQSFGIYPAVYRDEWEEYFLKTKSIEISPVSVYG